MVLGLLLTATLSRMLESDALGRYWIALSALSLVVLLSQSGVGQVTMSRVSQALALGHTVDAGRIAHLSLVLVTGVAASASFAIGFAALAMYEAQGRSFDLGIVVFIGLGGVLCSLCMQCVDLLRAQQRLTRATLLAGQPASGGLVQTSFLVAAMWLAGTALSPLGSREVAVYASFLIGWGLVLGIAAWSLFASRVSGAADGWGRWATLRELGAASVPVVFSAVTMFVITQADLWTVDRVLGGTDTATYGIASSLVKYVSAINVLLAALLPGMVGDLYARQELALLRNVLVRAARVSSVAGVAIFAALAFGGERLLALVVGDQYESALVPLLVLSVGHLANAVLGYSNIVLVTAGRGTAIVAASVTASLVTVALLAVLTPRYAMVGAAAASAIGVVTYNVMTWLQCGRHLGLWCHAFAPLNKPSANRIDPM